MLTQRWRPAALALAAVLVVWGLAMTVYSIAKNARMTAEKVATFVQSKDLSQLSGAARAQAIKELADKINALSPEERRKIRLTRSGWGWFEQMTEEEKSGFVEATMPSGFRQMLSSFEQLPEDKRRRSVEDALRGLREARNRIEAEDGSSLPTTTNTAPVLSRELEAKIRSIGLKTFYAESSAQTKAELAPVLEELQRVMESGRPFRRPH
jgi:uncharacterized protein YjeT (DUF2065 family)